MTRLIIILFLVTCFALSSAVAGEGRGYLGAQLRYFWQDPLFAGQSENSGSFSAWYEYYHDSESGDQRLNLSVFARIDSEDEERSHFDIRELYWWRGYENFEIYLGLKKIFWGVTESVHLVDIINQDDILENIDGEEKLGQPMIQLLSQQDWGLVEFFVLPYFREREYPGLEGRLRPGLPILDDAEYQSGSEEEHIDLALRWSHYFSVWDVSLSHFSGTNRDPVLMPVFEGLNSPALQANYQQIEQSGLALQATVDSWLYKLEAISIDEQDYGRNSAAALGLEYTFFTIGGGNADLGVITEYQWDDRIGARSQLAQNDLALGFRWAFNDLDGSEILAIVNQDLDYDNRFFSIEMSRRITENIKLEAEARIFSDAEEDSLDYQFRNEDYLQMELRWYF